jgi:hypothetical protein
MGRVSFCAILLSLLIALFASCNFFYNPLHGRENPNDYEGTVMSPFAFQVQPGEVEISFAWREVYYYHDDEDVVEEVMLVYSLGKTLPIRVVPIPPDLGGIYGYDRAKESMIYSERIGGLAVGDEVWFALYPRLGEKWLAPLYEHITLRDAEEIPFVTLAGPYSPERGAVMNYWGWMGSELGTSDSYTLENNTTTSQYLVLRFNLPDRVRCTVARLTLPFAASSTNNGLAYPIVYGYIEHLNDDGARIASIDYNNGSNFTISDAATGTALVTEAVNAAMRYGSDTILITLGPGQLENSSGNYGSESLTLDYEQY